MAELPKNLVVRTHAPARRVIMAVAVTLLGAFALYVVYELGRYDAGYDRLAVSQQRVELEVAIERLEKANRELRTRLAELETIRIGQTEERAEVARTIGELQAQVARQTQELAFYRGIVAQGTVPLGVKIQQLRVEATEEPARFQIRLTLVRSDRPEGTAKGAIAIRLEGASGTQASRLELPALTGGRQRELRFSFRHIQNLEQSIVVPAGFRPERLTVELRSDRRGSAPVTQSVPWKVEAS